jgi:hypothetical protein
MAKCITEECDNFLKPGSKLLHCTTCRHGLYYWNRKSVAQVVERQKRLTMLNSRLDAITVKSKTNKPKGRK